MTIRMYLKKYSLVLLLVSFGLLSGCSSLPKNFDKSASYSQQSPGNSTLTAINRQLEADKTGKSAVSMLRNGMDAFLARALLAKAANDSLDIQYYIWRNDTTGKILTLLLLEAADRGVRVRLLLDDINTQGLDKTLLALNQHKNIQVRLYNPFTNRTNRLWNLLTDFSRLNHRMHNKLFISDSSIAIVGGRNIGDEYFQASSTVEFDDADVLTIGPVIKQARTAFDHYWNSNIVFPVDAIANDAIASNANNNFDLDTLKIELQHFRSTQQDSEYAKELQQSQLLDNLLNNNLAWHWGDAKLLYDHIDKNKYQKDPQKIIAQNLAKELETLTHELIIISPYFVPGEILLEQFAHLRKQGVEIVIVTNSLKATDVPMVHAGYQKYRRTLLQQGIKLYETKSRMADSNNKNYIQFTSSAKNSLHAKAYIFDKKKLFIGSLNLDPRSIHINTEVGILFENETLARQASKNVSSALKDYAYKLNLEQSTSDIQPQDKIVWIEHSGDITSKHAHEPGVGPLKAIFMLLLSLLPIEEQL